MAKQYLPELISGKRWGMLGSLLSVFHLALTASVIALERSMPLWLIQKGLVEQPEGKIFTWQYTIPAILWALETLLLYS